jgi:integrase
MRFPPLDNAASSTSATTCAAADVSPRSPRARSCHQLVESLTHETNTEVRWSLVENLGTIRTRTRRSRSRKGSEQTTYFIDFRPHGRLWTHRGVPMPDEKTAERVLRQIRARVAEGRDLESVLADFAGSTAAPSHVTTWLTKWLDYMRRLSENGQRSPTYLAALESYAREDGHFSWWRGRSIHDISKRRLTEWRDSLLAAAERKLSPKSVKNVLDAFRSFTGWLADDHELLPRVPAFPTVQIDDPAPRHVDAATQAEILAAIPEDRRGIFLAMVLCVRPGEARALDARDFTRDSDGVGWLTVSKAAKGKSSKAPIRGTKTRRSRPVPVMPDSTLLDWIERHCDVSKAAQLAGAPLFPNPGATNPTRRWTDGAVHKVWNRAAAASGHPGVSLYEGTKHTTATHLLATGAADERTWMALTGHSETRTFRRYADLHPSALVVALGKVQRAAAKKPSR